MILSSHSLFTRHCTVKRVRARRSFETYFYLCLRRKFEMELINSMKPLNGNGQQSTDTEYVSTSGRPKCDAQLNCVCACVSCVRLSGKRKRKIRRICAHVGHAIEDRLRKARARGRSHTIASTDKTTLCIAVVFVVFVLLAGCRPRSAGHIRATACADVVSRRTN